MLERCEQIADSVRPRHDATNGRAGTRQAVLCSREAVLATALLAIVALPSNGASGARR